MKKILISVFALLLYINGNAQAKLVKVKSRAFKTTSDLKIEGEVGYLEVPENRKNPSSRRIRMKYVHLKSLSENPSAPVVYLEGGGGFSTWEVNSPKDLSDRIEYLEVADLIYLDRRGATDESLVSIWKGDFPENFFVSEELANEHYQNMAKGALEQFEKKEIDISGYNIEEHANDVNDLMTELGFDRYTLFGFSYGSHIAMTVMNLFPNRIERAILVGADAPDQAFNFPSYLDKHVEKISSMVAQDTAVNDIIPDFSALVDQTMQKLEQKPMTVTVKSPLTRKEVNLQIGPFGLALLLRLDIDDAYDIPILPRLLYSINQGDHSILTWFVQKRVRFALGLPGQGINQQLASGVNPTRWKTIEAEAAKSPFGNVVNFPFSAVKDHWIPSELSFDPSEPLQTSIPTLFLTGDLDCRTPVEQVEETRQGFSNSVHVVVENAGHEQAQWSYKVANEIIPNFMSGQTIEATSARYGSIRFIQVIGETTGHASID